MARFCKKCGNPLSEGTKFCAKCGASTGHAVFARPVQMQTAERSSDGAKKWIIVAGMVILFAGGGWYFWLGRKVDTPEAPAPVVNAPVAAEKQTQPPSVADSSSSKQNDKTVSEKAQPLDEHWFPDIRQGVLIWNPNPEEGESVEWNGQFLADGQYKYANGFGVAKWYLNGNFEQLDEGNYEHGKRHGRFKQEFSDGRIVYSEWQHGTKIR